MTGPTTEPRSYVVYAYNMSTGEYHEMGGLESLVTLVAVPRDADAGEYLASYTGPAAVAYDPDAITTCGCGHVLVRTGEGWQHDAAPYFWGDDHDPHPLGVPPTDEGYREQDREDDDE